MVGKALLLLALAMAAAQAASILGLNDGKITDLTCEFEKTKSTCKYNLTINWHNKDKPNWSADANLTSPKIPQKDMFCLYTYYNVSGDASFGAAFYPGPVPFIDVEKGQGTGTIVRNVVQVTPGTASFWLVYTAHVDAKGSAGLPNVTAQVSSDCQWADKKLTLF